MLERMWINQPSTLQEFHGYHGMNVLAEKSNGETKGWTRIWFTSGPVSNMEIRTNALSRGWNDPPHRLVSTHWENCP